MGCYQVSRFSVPDKSREVWVTQGRLFKELCKDYQPWRGSFHQQTYQEPGLVFGSIGVWT